MHPRKEGISAEVLARQGSGWLVAPDRRPGPPVADPLHVAPPGAATGVDCAPNLQVESAAARLEEGFRWDDEFGAVPLLRGGSGALHHRGASAKAAYFGRPFRSRAQARRLVGEQLDDGGWNCEMPARCASSFQVHDDLRARGAARI